ANPEPQSDVFIPWVAGLIALTRRSDDEAADRFADAIERFRRFSVENNTEVFPDAVRAQLRAGRRDVADGYRDLSMHGRSPTARADASVVEGLLADDPAEARRLLGDGIAALEGLGLRIDAARAMVDLGRVIARAGEDPTPLLERAREILVECDARAFLFEVDDALAGR
ncbi:MAG: hypothetical protein ACRDGW_06400, partial [Actinomycetota bacterium]